MAYLNITASDVYQALENNNVSISSGAIHSQDRTYVLVSDTQLHTADEFSRIVVRSEHGQAITIGDVARVQLGEGTLEHQPVLVNRQKGIVMQVRPDIRNSLQAMFGSGCVRPLFMGMCCRERHWLIWNSRYGTRSSPYCPVSRL